MGGRLAVCLGLLMALGAMAGADEKAATMRQLVADHGEAVVTVKMAIKETMSMAEYGSEVSEYTQEIPATVISAEGLMVTSLLQLDPGAMMANMFFEESGDEEGFETKTEVTSLRVLKGQDEVESEVVLRDTDLDLAFMRPVKKPESAWPHVDLTAPPTVQVFDVVFVLGRMGRVANRIATVGETRVQGIIEKPRLTYILGEYPGQGMPVYTESDACMGINVTRFLKVSSGSGAGYSSGYQSNMASIVVPGPDIVELVAQVPAYAETK